MTDRDSAKKPSGRPDRLVDPSAEALASLYFGEKLSLAEVAIRTSLGFYAVRTTLLRAGHRLRSRAESIRVGHKRDKSKWLTVAQRVAAQHGGECLSTEYVAAQVPLAWRCAEGHCWRASLNNVKDGGTWCPKCGGRLPLTTEEMYEIAVQRGGRCLSTEYINNQTNLRWECSNGHQWCATPANIKRGKWCPACAGNTRLTIEDMRVAAEEQGGKCLSSSYVDSQTKLLWECAKGHQWWAVPSSVRQGTWCRKCAGLDKPALDELQRTAEDRGGMCLAKTYKSAKSKLLWECAYGHRWRATWDKIRQGSWCPKCSTALGERICRAYFAQLFHAEFPKSRPTWLVNDENNQLELDGYNQELDIAFEHQGRQHYEAVPYFGHSEQRLQKRQRDDETKRRICAERGIVLVEVPGIPDLLHLADVRNHIRAELERQDRSVPDHWDTKTVNLKVAFASPLAWEHLERLKEIATENGGRCLSEAYVNDTTKLRWECDHGHQWEAVPSSVKQGSWCPECAGTRKKTINEARHAAESRGGECLTKQYIDSKSPMSWKCARGHRWEAPLGRILRGVWCPRCAGRGKTVE